LNHYRTNVLLRALVWLGVFAWWISLKKPAGASVFEVRPGLASGLGLALTLVGLIILTWSAVTLAGGVATGLAAPAELLTRGPYRYVRNPLYLAAGAVLAGLSTLYAPWRFADLVMVAVLAALAHVVVVRVEEPATRNRFGAPYDEYCRLVGRWLPRSTGGPTTVPPHVPTNMRSLKH
jgi:protein-S-isoprenylcysteine O-methyltransferase Ste14